jgi:transcriptional regulator with XRE-family HTH domain
VRRKLASNVRALRADRGLTLEQAAERAEMAWRHWQKVEAGEVNATLRTLARLAEALGTTAAELLM